MNSTLPDKPQSLSIHHFSGVSYNRWMVRVQNEPLTTWLLSRCARVAALPVGLSTEASGYYSLKKKNVTTVLQSGVDCPKKKNKTYVRGLNTQRPSEAKASCRFCSFKSWQARKKRSELWGQKTSGSNHKTNKLNPSHR